jgi:putative nucleotidyltransferase with HDIG domain
MRTAEESPTHPEVAANYRRVPEVAAHCRRVAELCRRASTDRVTAALLYACRDLDNALEFAAYEGVSLSDAIGEFLDEAPEVFDPTVLEALRRLTTPVFRPTLTGDLPVLPAAALKLMRTTAEGTSVAEISAIAGSDPVLTLRLLGVANSAAFGRPGETIGLSQAVLRLGVSLSRKTLLGACLGGLFASSALKEVWQHSNRVAAIAYDLAAGGAGDAETAWLAGLLHDVGRLITHRCPAEAQAEASVLLAAGFPLVYAETLVYGIDHAALGGDLLARWQLPAEIAEAVRWHHRPESTESVLAGIVCLAEDEARAAGTPSESLSAGMRRAAACRIAGLPALFRRDATAFARAV